MKIDPLALSQILSAEGLTHSAFVLMLATFQAPKRRLSLCELSRLTGMSYYAVNFQVKRSLWIHIDRKADSLIHATLSPEGEEMLRRIARRLSKLETPGLAATP